MSATVHPAPWRTDVWLPEFSKDGAYVWNVVDALRGVVLYDCGEEIAKRVVEVRNSGDEARNSEALRERYEGFLAAKRAEIEEVRAHFHAEIATYALALEQCRAQKS